MGIAGDICGGALTLVALAHAPISIVQPVMCSGMGMSALIAVYYLHEAIAPPDWFSTFLILLGRHPLPPPHVPAHSRTILTFLFFQYFCCSQPHGSRRPPPFIQYLRFRHRIMFDGSLYPLSLGSPPPAEAHIPISRFS
jgi:hypothetical protein